MRQLLRAATGLVCLALVAACNSSVAGLPALPSVTAVVSTGVTRAVPPTVGQVPLPAITQPTSGPATESSGSPGSSLGPTTTPSDQTPGTVLSTAQPTSGASTSTGAPVTPTTPDGAVGSVGIGDAYYPTSGNGGYQVDAYDITMTYDPATDDLTATTVVTGTVTEAAKLGRFDLDLQPTMNVSEVTVNGAAAAYEHSGAELVVTPKKGLAQGAALSVVVTYAGRPDKISGGTAGSSNGGWYRTPTGGAIAIGEPFSASAWYPVNEHPSDPASFRVTATVPSKWSVISNGVPTSGGLPTAPAGMKVFRWTQRKPVTSYETTIYIDTFTTVTGRMIDGRPVISAIAPGTGVAKYQKLAAQQAAIVDVLSSHFGRYPFESVGGIYTGQQLAFALETATRPVYANWVDEPTVVHELTHQWFGDDVFIKRWSDICLNECFASYGPWLWSQDYYGADLDADWVAEMAKAVPDPQFWASPLVDMGPGKEFTSVYDRGPLAIHALRKQMGEKAFAALLKGWPASWGGKAASWSDFVAYANKISGQNLTAFIGAWFAGTTVPPARYLHPGGIGK